MSSKQRILSVRTPWGIDNIPLRNRSHRKAVQRLFRDSGENGYWGMQAANRRAFYGATACYSSSDLDAITNAIRTRTWRTRVRRAPRPVFRMIPREVVQ